MSYAALYDYQQAQVYLKNAIQRETTNVNYRFQYGRLLIQAGFPDEAAAELAACIGMDSTYIPALFQLGLLYAARKDNPQKEIAIFSSLIRQNPKDFLSFYYIGDALKRMNYADSGMIYVEQSITLNPKYFPSLVAGAHYKNANKEYAAALELYRQAEALRPRDKDLLFNIGECLRKLGSLHSAVDYFTKAIAIDSTNAFFHAQLGYAYFSLNQFDSSIAAYKTAIVCDRDNIQYYLNLARAYERIDSVQGVVRTYHDGIRALRPENISYAYNSLAIYYRSKQMWREAAEAYEHVYEYNPSNAMALFWAGDSYTHVPDNGSAADAYEKHVKLLAMDSTTLQQRTYIKKLITTLRKKGR